MDPLTDYWMVSASKSPIHINPSHYPAGGTSLPCFHVRGKEGKVMCLCQESAALCDRNIFGKAYILIILVDYAVAITTDKLTSCTEISWNCLRYPWIKFLALSLGNPKCSSASISRVFKMRRMEPFNDLRGDVVLPKLGYHHSLDFQFRFMSELNYVKRSTRLRVGQLVSNIYITSSSKLTLFLRSFLYALLINS